MKHDEKIVSSIVMTRKTRSSRIMNLIRIFAKEKKISRQLAYNAARPRCWDGQRGKRPALMSVSAMLGEHITVAPLLNQACIYLSNYIYIKAKGVL